MKYSAKSIPSSKSKFLLLILILISASKLEPISLLDLFSSIAILASCFILNNFTHLLFNSSLFQLAGTSTKVCS